MKFKKPKFWDYNKPTLLALTLYPLGLLVDFINTLKKKQKRKKFKIKTVCFGNIYIGGTGKTSLSIKLNDILKDKNIKSCFIKKFHRNQLDEQKILKKNGDLFLSSERIKAINEAEKNNFEIAILDDGLQDSSIDTDVNIVCFNNHNWIGNGMTIPAGPLRENIKNLKKYENVFLSGNLENLENIQNEILKINPNLNIHIGVYEPINLSEFDLNNNYLVFSGIGNHQTFIAMLKKHNIKILKEIEFPDHFQYNDNDIRKIIKTADKLDCEVITTEKDYLRLENLNLNEIKFIKSEIKILDEQKLLKAIL